MSSKVFKDITIDRLEEVADFLLNNAQNRILAMYGEMGMGKTTFSRVLCSRLRVDDEVNSPTFSLVNEYRASNGEPVYHFDFYRINDEQEALDMGCEEYFYSGAWCIIEWPENISNVLPEEAVVVRITASSPDSRQFDISNL